jgi:transcriptional regulator with XRE-family HTH domain
VGNAGTVPEVVMKEERLLRILEAKRLELGLSRRELSVKAKLSHATYASLFKPKHEVSLRVASAVLKAVGLKIGVSDDPSR